MNLRMWLAVVAFGLGSAAAHAQEFTPPPAAELAPGESASVLLPALIAHSRHVAELEGGRLSGEGAEFLRELGRNAHFVVLGEDHGNAGIAEFAAAYWRELNALGYEYAALEIDPYTAAALERELRAGGLAAWGSFLAERNGALGAPFVNWRSEAELAEAIVETSTARQRPAIWGLDQVFIGGATWQLREIAAHTRSERARALAEALAADAVGLDGFARIDPERLGELRAALTHRRDARLAEWVDAMMASRRIYGPFTGGGGEAYFANHERETLMKRLFLAQYEAAAHTDQQAPRVMLKFGSYRTYRGATPTQVQGLGGFVTEFATSRGQQAVTINVMCGPGGQLAQLLGEPVSCDAPREAMFPFLTPYIAADQVTVFDLRVWRLRPGRWEHLPAAMRAMISSFDVLVFVPNGAAAQLLPGLPPPAAPAE